MLKLNNVSVSYDGKKNVLENINLEIHKGEWVGVIGRSGSGKSTLLRSINLLTKPKGDIFIDSDNIVNANKIKLRKLRRKIAFIFQDYNLIDSLTVLENVLTSRLGYQNFLQSLFGIYSEKDYERANKALDRLGLAEKIYEKARNLSGGQKQRVAIAKALCQDADIILADEPVSSLDPSTTIQIMDYFKLIHEKKNKTIITNLHQIEIAKKYCQRIVAIKDGNIIYDGLAGDLNDEIIKQLYEK